ncbi:MAG: class I SAM-dependent rRNA methyltransferase [Deltaproteobacteria bacterium]|nr:class I SAM-dependent rRNA methyltransferase [Deltaproteobacteria bacterium]MBI4374141.1 class I SAM-dependent rRNA methyltransferase [Deltaproteobacteria bacterium]
MTKITINRHGTDRVLDGHPWVFRSDILGADGGEGGEIIELLSPKKRFLGYAFYNPISQISLRILTTKRETIDPEFWTKRFLLAVAGRRAGPAGGSRLVFSESDRLPGLIVDRYCDVIVFQTLSLGMDRLKTLWIDLIDRCLKPSAIVERNEPAVREKEGLPKERGIVRGGLSGSLFIEESGRSLWVDPLEGQKTGLYLDQAENHVAATRYASGRVLDLFCYQGGFSIPIAANVEEVIAVDSSGPALMKAQENLEQNKIENVRLVEANSFDTLRAYDERREKFEMVILDPPPFVATKEVSGARRGYKEINLRAMKILKEGGVLVTCSCSQNFTPQMFYEILLEAAHDTHRQLQLLERRGAASDHPVLMTFPESNYLQCWILRVM